MGRRWAVITGAANGIGLALTRHLVTSCPNMRILAVDKDKDGLRHLAEKYPYIVKTVFLDLAEASSVKTISESIPEGEEVTFLVHNAAIVCLTMWGEITRDLADYAFAVNVTVPFLITLTLLPKLKEAKGRVLYVGAVFAEISEVGYSLYGITKAAGLHMYKTLNTELSEAEVSSGYVLPGAVDTNAFHKDAQLAIDSNLPFAEILKKALKGGMKSPAYAAKFLAFLLFDTDDEEFKNNIWNIMNPS